MTSCLGLLPRLPPPPAETSRVLVAIDPSTMTESSRKDSRYLPTNLFAPSFLPAHTGLVSARNKIEDQPQFAPLGSWLGPWELPLCRCGWLVQDGCLASGGQEIPSSDRQSLQSSGKLESGTTRLAAATKTSRPRQCATKTVSGLNCSDPGAVEHGSLPG
jgi:hypothetical protein